MKKKENGDDCADEEEEENMAWTISTRGNKRQRKVGRTVRRALEAYNSKCMDHEVEEEEDGRVAMCREISSIASENTDHRSEYCPPFFKENFHGRENKKSRQRSPDRGLCEDNVMDDADSNPSSHDNPIPNDVGTETNSVPMSNISRSLMHQFDPERMRTYFETLSRIVYEVITKEAKNTIAALQEAGMCGNRKWIWWNDGEVDNVEAIIPKWCSFKTSQSTIDFNDRCNSGAKGCGGVVVASTPACAAVHGLSKGGINKCALIRSVVEALENLQVTSREEGDTPRLRGVSFHEKSGHVLITLDVPSSMVAFSTVTGIEPSPNPTKHDPVSIPAIHGKKSSNEDVIDPISEFMLRQASITQQLSGTTAKRSVNEDRSSHRHQRRYLTVRSVPVHESTLQPEVHQLYCRYQTAIHGDGDPYFDDAVDSNNEKDSNLDDTHGYNSYRQKKCPPGFLDVDAAYVHLDEERRSKIKLSYLAFYRFLGETPVAVQTDKYSAMSYPHHLSADIRIPYGTYHQQYRLSTSKDSFDGPLIAVGVVDILPHCLSSVYSFYDPILSSILELGKYTALCEIEWVRHASRIRPDLHYYYLGENCWPCIMFSFFIDIGHTHRTTISRILHPLLQKDDL